MLSILSSFVIAFVFYPLYKKLLKRIKNQNISALTISIMIVLLITVPTILIINNISNEVTNLYQQTSIELSENTELIEVDCNSDNLMCKAIKGINENQRIRFYIAGAVTNLAAIITRESSSFLFSIPKKIVDVLIIFLLVFFTFKGGNYLWKLFGEILPLKKNHKKRILDKFSSTINGIVYGYLVIALIEAIVGWFAFFILGSKMALIIGIIIGILGLIPMIGAAIVWVPTALVYLFAGNIMGVIVMIVMGILIMILDLWARAEVIGTQTDIHPAIVALGVLGGAITFGPVGVVIGPLILSLVIAGLEIYQKEKNLIMTKCV
jgi:predicted PurR-regulated permease PerM